MKITLNELRKMVKQEMLKESDQLELPGDENNKESNDNIKSFTGMIRNFRNALQVSIKDKQLAPNEIANFEIILDFLVEMHSQDNNPLKAHRYKKTDIVKILLILARFLKTHSGDDNLRKFVAPLNGVPVQEQLRRNKKRLLERNRYY